MSTWSSTVTGGTWYYNSDNTDIGLPIMTPDSSPSLSSYIDPPDLTNIKMLWKFPTTATVNIHLPYPGVYSPAPDLTDVKLSWDISLTKNYGLPCICDIPTSGAFARCANLVSVSIPKTVTKIDYYTFDGCSSLTTAKFSAKSTFHDTSFPSTCELHFDAKDLVWCPCGLDSSGHLYETITRVAESDYLPVHESYVGFRPDLTFPAGVGELQWAVAWYHNATFLRYDDFAPLTTYRPVCEGANRYRFCFRYSDDSTIERNNMGGSKELLWLSTPISTTDINEIWVRKSCSTSDGTTLTNSNTSIFCETYIDVEVETATLFETSNDEIFELADDQYYEVDSAEHNLFTVDARTISGDKLDYEVFIWTDSTFDGTCDYVSDGTCHNLAGNKMRIQLKKHDNSNISPDELAYVRIIWY